MKLWFHLLLALAAAAPSCLLAAEAVPPPLPFRAGAALVDITPDLGGDIIGGFHPFPSTHVHDPLHARCLVLDNGKTRLALVVCDLIGLSRTLCDEIRRQAEETLSLPGSHLLLCGTHTHSACSALGKDRFAFSPELDDYQRFVARRILDAIRCASHRLAPAQIAWGSAQEPRHVFNRRWFMKPGTIPLNPLGSQDQVKMNPPRASENLVRPAGPTDPEISFLAVRSPEGRPLALFANYSLHYVGGVGSGDISADYYGVFCDRIQELLQADRQDPPFVAMMSNGTSGNINNIDFTKPAGKLAPYQKIREVANDVAQAVSREWPRLAWHSTVPLGACLEQPETGFRHPSPEELARAQKILAARDPQSQKPASLEEIYAERMLKIAAYPEKAPIPLQVMRIGDLGVATLPCEVFVETGLQLKQKSPFPEAFAVSLAHGYFGYLPTVEHHRLGGYETWMGTNRLEIEAEPKLVQALLGMMERLQKGE